MAVIVTARLVLRPLRGSDAHRLAVEANDMRIAENLRDGFPHPYSVRDARRFINQVRAEGEPSVLAITVDDAPIGCMGVTPGMDVYRFTAEVGYWLGVAHWGRGYASEALAAFTEHVFATTELERLHGDVFSGNPASGRVLEKCGYVLESVQPRAVFKYGVFRDLAVYARLRA